jgi:membrane-bound ClpP family serine protease
MMSGATLGVTTGDLLIILSILLLFIEILKATRFGVKSIVDHLLSFVVFVAALLEFIMVQKAATSTFLIFLVICAVDVIGGFSISIRAASRDYNVDGHHPVAH